MRVWSFSSLKAFKTCPHQFQQVKVLKRFVSLPTAATEFGTALHAVFEDAVKANSAADIPDMGRPYQPLVETILATSGEKLTEHHMALTRMGTSCSYDSTAAQGCAIKGIADLVVLKGKRAVVADYKTGKSAKYADISQLELMAIMIFAANPEVETVTGILIFVVAGQLEIKDWHRSQFPVLWGGWVQSMALAERALQAEHQQKKPSGLCRGWCPVTDCDFYEPPKK
jgi:RecB family exonuclease